MHRKPSSLLACKRTTWQRLEQLLRVESCPGNKRRLSYLEKTKNVVLPPVRPTYSSPVICASWISLGGWESGRRGYMCKKTFYWGYTCIKKRQCHSPNVDVMSRLSFTIHCSILCADPTVPKPSRNCWKKWSKWYQRSLARHWRLKKECNCCN